MKKSSSVWILPIVAAPYLYSEDAGLLTRGLYGNVEYSFIQDNIADVNNRASQSTFTQKYTLGQRGFIYSPNLLRYLLQGSFLVNDSSNDTSGVSMQTTTKNSNYRVNTDFIPSTKYPFSLYGEKSTTPYSSIQSSSSLSYNETSDRYGLNGSADLSYFNLRYGVGVTSLQRDGSFDSETRHNNDYTVSISQNYNHGMLSATYSDTSRDYLRNEKSMGLTQQWNDRNHDASINGTWNVDKTLSVASMLNYRDNSYIDMKNFTASSNINWRPNDKYNGGLNLSINKMDAKTSSITNAMIGGNSTYKVTPEFSTTQNISLYRMDGDTTSQTMGTAMLGGNYIKSFENNLVVNTGVSVFTKSEKNSVSSDLNTTLPDRDSYSYTISSGASKMIDSIKTRISANMSYYNSISTLDEKSKRFNATLMATATLSDEFNYRFSSYYVKDQNQYFNTFDNNISQENSEILTLDNSLSYVQDVGFRGKLTIGGGVMYTVTKSAKEVTVSRIAPHAESSFSYRFFQAMFFTSMLSASQDSVSDLTNYSATMGLNTMIRLITISLGARYTMQTGGTLYERSQNSAFFKVSRRF